MKLIERLSSMIEDEIDGAREYAMMALEYRDDRPEMARIMYNHSLVELQHMSDLHAVVVDVINDYRAKNGEPPAGMKAIYDYLHKQHIEDAAEVKNLQNMYAAR